MTILEALKILHSLAEGRDPETDTVYGNDSPYQRASTVRALYVAIRALENPLSQVAPASSDLEPLEAAPLTARETEIFERLRLWRLEKAREYKISAFMVMHNRVLEEIARRPIRTPDDLLQIKGIGTRGVEKYGQEIVALLAFMQISEVSAVPFLPEVRQAVPNVVQTLDAAKLRFPPAQFSPLLLTEVTHMQGDCHCIAGWDIHHGEMRRPLLPGHKNWIFDEFQYAFYPGQLVNAPYEKSSRGFAPHRHEDAQLTGEMRALETWTEAELHAALLPFTLSKLTAIFGRRPLEDRYFEEGTDCPSLGGLHIARQSLGFITQKDRLRLRLTDSDGITTTLPVTCRRLKTRFDPTRDEAAGFDANRWLEQIPATQRVILRVGLARGFVGKDNEFIPKRCYLQINGIVLPITDDPFSD